jgi:sulfopyruvate decarboxylase TPP-binding subunit
MSNPTPKARQIVDELYRSEVTHVVYLIGKTIAHIIELMSSENKMTLIPVCREADTLAVAAGLMTGGKRAVVMMQSTGVYESGDSIRTLGLDVKLPILLLIGYRGWMKDEPVKDSAARLLEPTFEVWNIPTHIIETVQDAEMLHSFYEEAQELSKPVALLITPEVTVEA